MIRVKASKIASRVPCLAPWCLLVACTYAGAPPTPAERASQTAVILEQVLRFELRQFATAATGAANATVCLAVRDDSTLSDPSEALLRALADHPHLRPSSACTDSSPITLVAGPIEWLRDGEVRVKGEFRRAPHDATPLAYRVVWEHDHWTCLGPIISWDPL